MLLSLSFGIPTFRLLQPSVLSDITLGCRQQEAISGFTLNRKSHFGVPHPSLLKDGFQKNVKRIWFRFLRSTVTCRRVSSSWLPATAENSSVCKLRLPSQGREGRRHGGGGFSPLPTSDWCTLRLCLWCDWGRRGRLFVRLRKHGGQQEHLIVAKPFEDKPRASFTACKNVVDRPGTWDQSCSSPSYWVKGNECGSTLACTCLCHREGSHQAVKKLCVPWGFMMCLCTMLTVSGG